MDTLTYFMPHKTSSNNPRMVSFTGNQKGSIRTFKGDAYTVTRHRTRTNCFDIIISGICVTQLAGPNDSLCQHLADGKDPETYNNYFICNRALETLAKNKVKK